LLLLRRELIDLFASILVTWTAGAISTLHVLDGIGSASEACFAANRTSHAARAMDLHVHIQVVLVFKTSIAFLALKGWAATVDTAFATRVASSLPPLIATELMRLAAALTLGATTTHCLKSLSENNILASFRTRLAISRRLADRVLVFWCFVT
jgi:hypothetical protein